jgi:Na+/proline symporter
MEVVGVVFIASNHFLAVAPFLAIANDPHPWSGWSAPAHQRLKSQWSTITAISTAIVHFMCRQMSDKVVTDGPAVHPGRSARTLKKNFIEPVIFGFSGFITTG